MATFDHSLGLFEHDSGDFHVTLGGLVERRGDDLGFDGAGHIGDFLGTLVNEQHHQVGFGMVGGNRVGDVLHQNGLTRFGLGDDEGTLTLSDGRKEIDDARREIRGFRVAAERVFFFGEERCEMLEGDAVAHFRGHTAIDFLDIGQREIFLAVAWRSHGALHHVASLQSIAFHEVVGYVDVVGRRKVVVVARTQEAVAVGHNFEYTVGFDEVVEVEIRAFRRLTDHRLHWLNGLLHANRRIVENVVGRQCAVVFDGNIDNGDEIGAVARVACPHLVDGFADLVRFVVGIDFCLQLCQQILVLAIVPVRFHGCQIGLGRVGFDVFGSRFHDFPSHSLVVVLLQCLFLGFDGGNQLEFLFRFASSVLRQGGQFLLHFLERRRSVVHRFLNLKIGGFVGRFLRFFEAGGGVFLEQRHLLDGVGLFLLRVEVFALFSADGINVVGVFFHDARALFLAAEWILGSLCAGLFFQNVIDQSFFVADACVGTSFFGNISQFGDIFLH